MGNAEQELMHLATGRVSCRHPYDPGLVPCKGVRAGRFIELGEERPRYATRVEVSAEGPTQEHRVIPVENANGCGALAIGAGDERAER